MYSLLTVRDTVRLTPDKFSEDLEKGLLKIAQEEYEGIVDEDNGIVIAVTGIENASEGKLVPGDGSAYFEADIKMLIFKPDIGEIVEGNVSEITEFGAFVRIGPIEGLVHVSQIMDEYINYDKKTPAFIGKETKKKLQLEDLILAKIVTVSLKGSIPNSKIGMTMRQPGLGKSDWVKMGTKKEGRIGRDERKKEKFQKQEKYQKPEKKERKK